MRNFYLPFLLLVLANSLCAQWDMPRFFPAPDSTITNHTNSLLLEDANDNLHYFWKEGIVFYHSISDDDGVTWSAKNVLEDGVGVTYFDGNELTGLVTATGRILVVYRLNSNFALKYSDDNGAAWSNTIILPATILYNSSRAKLWSSDNEIWLIYNKSRRAYYIKSTDNGLNWSNELDLYAFPNPEAATSINVFATSSNYILIYNYQTNLYNQIEYRVSADSGTNWSDKTVILNTEGRSNRIAAVQKSQDEIIIFYSKDTPTPFNNIVQYDLFKVITTDGGVTWSEEIKFTNFVGDDRYPNLTSTDENVYLSFYSERGTPTRRNGFWYAKLGSTIDTLAPPNIYNFTKIVDENNLSVQITAQVDDDTKVDSVKIDYSVNDNSFEPVYMFDDGMHGDSLENDKIFGFRFANFNNNDKLEFKIIAIDDEQNKFVTEDQILYISSFPLDEVGVIDVNNIKLPFDNKGVLADAITSQTSIAGGRYDDITFLFSSGFYLSGLRNDSLWSNGVLSASRIEDYQAGKVNSDPDNYLNKLYFVHSSDPPFGLSWQTWELAVELGAKFYDGNNDGIYNPVDLNYNGQWDLNEDRPDFQGDITAWCVFNDGVPQSERRYTINPQGIEIKQTLFASGGTANEFEDIIFVRYEIENMGSVAELFDSVYFAAGADPDLGDYQNDVLGCDTLEQAGYAYELGPDSQYGNNPPAFFIKQLQGPPVFIPSETFIDNNSDDEFTLGVDTPLDSAVVKKGKYLGMDYIPGAKNLAPNAFTQYMSSHPTNGDPDTHFELRNYMLGGRGKNGGQLDPCTWDFGNGSSLSNCNTLDPNFMYSGDPVTGEGWINIVGIDQRFLLSSGPFKLHAGEPIELIYAYIVGRGTDHLNSVTKAREISQFAQQVYDNNFEDLPTGIDDDENLIVNEFKLYQNYPNPFNPSTTIKFTIPPNVGTSRDLSLRLKIYDILGREVKTLVNEQKPAGTYEVQFDASSLSSGVYFYQLSAGSFVETKKLMLLK